MYADRVQEELSRVVGSHQIRMEDRKKLPYTDAVIHESQRFANIVPLSIPHKTSQDVTFQGYFVEKVSCPCHTKFNHISSMKDLYDITHVGLPPQGTPVIPLLTSVLYDESEWESPHTFNPSHFLDGEGKFTGRDAFMPFSAGTATL